MSAQPPPKAEGPGYEVRIEGHLDEHWATWFDGMTLVRQDDGTTILRGPVADQSALHGLLAKVRDLGAPLISVTPTCSASSPGSPIRPRGSRDRSSRG